MEGTARAYPPAPAVIPVTAGRRQGPPVTSATRAGHPGFTTRSAPARADRRVRLPNAGAPDGADRGPATGPGDGR
ncbi:hypothetical protein GCM10027160_32620 [Streptomyces calidiresistens]